MDDLIVEGDELVTVTLDSIVSGDSDVSIGAADNATVTIFDEETALIFVEATTPDATEPNVDGQFTVSLSLISSTDTTVTYTVSGDATSGDDFVPLTGTATILAGQLSTTIDVSVIDDSILENTENVTVTLDAITDGDPQISIGVSTATVNIADDDSASVSITANDSVAGEPSDDGQFTVTLDGVSATDTTISYTISGDATDGDDFISLTGEVTILAGQTTATIDVNVVDDSLLEDNETLTVTLDAITAGDADIAIGTANSDSVTITDDDTAEVTIVASDATASEPADNGQFTVLISNPSDTDTVVTYTVSGDATGGDDFQSLTGTVTILASQTSATIDVTTLDDSIVESSGRRDCDACCNFIG